MGRLSRYSEFLFLAVVLVALAALFSALSDRFWSFATLQAITNRIPSLALTALGMTFVLVAGQIDLSVGSVSAVAGALFGWCVADRSLPIAVGAAAAVAAGLGCGLLTGALVNGLRMPSFIVTLGLLEARGARHPRFWRAGRHAHTRGDRGRAGASRRIPIPTGFDPPAMKKLPAPTSERPEQEPADPVIPRHMKLVRYEATPRRLTALIPWLLGLALAAAAHGAVADLILHHGKVVTVDRQFSIAEAIAVADGRILAVGSDAKVLALAGARTTTVDLGGKMLLPGLIDSHMHPGTACTVEFDHPLPAFETIQDVLAYIKARARVVPAGDWIVLDQVFITRLREQRYPTRQELDRAAPDNPVAFRTGPDASVNSLALKLSGLDRHFKVPAGEPGFAERDPRTGELTGILRGCTRYLKIKTSTRKPTEAEALRLQTELFHDYNSVGLTTVTDRDSNEKLVNRYAKLRDRGTLTVRIVAVLDVSSHGTDAEIEKNIRHIAEHPLARDRSGLVSVIGMKTFLDGGMLTGTAYMSRPWGVSRIYAITDPEYRGVRNISQARLVAMVRTAVECNLQFTAHSQGDGAVQALLDAYEEVNRSIPIRDTRPCISHSSFMSRDAIAQAARLGVSLDVQPAWLYLDTKTLVTQFGYDRLRYFQPLRTCFALGVVAGGGSDHMQKIGARRSINPYDPFLGMWVTLTRRARWYEGQLHPEEALNRRQAIEFYTRNNAHLLRLDGQVGSLEPGAHADFIVVDRDLLECPVDDVRDTRVLSTYFAGKCVYRR